MNCEGRTSKIDEIDHTEQEVLDEHREYTVEEICSVCRLAPSRLTDYIQHALIPAILSPDRRIVKETFTHVEMHRLVRAVRVRREFEIDIADLALVVDLLDTLEIQRRELAILKQLTLTPG